MVHFDCDKTNPLEVEHITKTFGVHKAVDDISFTVRYGEMFSLLGPNGAGKTTTTTIYLPV